jgi:uncharacterized protein (UPF0212 family)
MGLLLLAQISSFGSQGCEDQDGFVQPDLLHHLCHDCEKGDKSRVFRSFSLELYIFSAITAFEVEIRNQAQKTARRTIGRIFTLAQVHQSLSDIYTQVVTPARKSFLHYYFFESQWFPEKCQIRLLQCSFMLRIKFKLFFIY